MPRRRLARLRSQAAAFAGLSYLLGVVAAPIPAPTAAPTSTGATSGQPASAPTARPVPAPMPPPVRARSPQVSPQAESAKASGSTITATNLVFMTDLEGDAAGPLPHGLLFAATEGFNDGRVVDLS